MRAPRAVAALLALAVAAGCTGPRRATPAPPPAPAIDSRAVPGGATLGAKWDWSRVDRFAPYLGRLPGGATFYELVWCAVEPRPGASDWSSSDRVVHSARRLGYQLYLKLRVGSCWATTTSDADRRGAKGKTASAMPADLERYRGWVQAAVRRYAPMGSGPGRPRLDQAAAAQIGRLHGD